MTPRDAQQVILIVGNGRSGTNWLMNILDASSTTFCRSEPLDISSSPIHALPDAEALARGADAEMAAAWDAFVAWTSAHMGERDLRIRVRKRHLRAIPQRLRLVDLHARNRIRTQIRKVWPSFCTGEWDIPWIFRRSKEFGEATVVIKVNGLPEWHCKWVLENRPEVKIIHIIRHPGGSLHSATKRFFESLDPAAIERERALYAGQVGHAIDVYGEWAARGLDPEAMDLPEALAWSWRYQNEQILAAGSTCDNYRLVVYENLAADPTTTARTMFEFCGLELTGSARASVLARSESNNWQDLAGSSEFVAHRWRNEASPKTVALAATVLESSELAKLWTDPEP